MQEHWWESPVHRSSLNCLSILCRPQPRYPAYWPNGEGVGIRRDPDAAEKALDVTGQTAAIAGDDKADALRVSNIGLHRRLTHHDDVRIAETFCDVLCKVQTVAASGIAEYNVFCSLFITPLLNNLHALIVA